MTSESRGIELERAVAALARDLPRLRSGEACARIAWLKRQAVAGGFAPAATVADRLADAIDRDRPGTPLGPWLEALAMAAGCGAGDAETASAILGTIGVRMAG